MGPRELPGSRLLWAFGGGTSEWKISLSHACALRFLSSKNNPKQKTTHPDNAPCCLSLAAVFPLPSAATAGSSSENTHSAHLQAGVGSWEASRFCNLAFLSAGLAGLAAQAGGWSQATASCLPRPPLRVSTKASPATLTETQAGRPGRRPPGGTPGSAPIHCPAAHSAVVGPGSGSMGQRNGRREAPQPAG